MRYTWVITVPSPKVFRLRLTDVVTVGRSAAVAVSVKLNLFLAGRGGQEVLVVVSPQCDGQVLWFCGSIEHPRRN